ncbi:hypothetical protein QJS10_CPA06g00712 [Acorus calamus]|uniref:Nucleoside phosphorylase domain-containing protein n=1 Tax=Acorus calamus TaxID=4465 RepID=A0AAV9EP34_ACOCL|nr:hypothetical protein QJS10_CPA06g00712 [Acorus calamus]
MGGVTAFGILILPFLTLIIIQSSTEGATPADLQREINLRNSDGPYIGVVIPNLFEMNPLLHSPSFLAEFPYIDFGGRRFRFGTIEGKKVILVMTGLGMINAGIATQMLLDLFNVEGIVHYGTAGNANPSLNIGDVTIPQFWAHTALWNWQRYGDGPEDQLSLEADGDYTREIGYLNFSNYTTDAKLRNHDGNLLNSVWYQPEEVFTVSGTPEERDHAFWVPVDSHYFELSKNLEGLNLESCLNSTTCLKPPPRVVTVHRGTSASIFLSNAAYRRFLREKFDVSPFDMESASVALVCFQQRIPFIAMRALSNNPSVSPESIDASTFLPLSAANAVRVVAEFINLLRSVKVVDVSVSH